MKKLIFPFLLLVVGCAKKESTTVTTTKTSEFNVTFNGKTFHETVDNSTMTTTGISLLAGVNQGTNLWSSYITLNTNNLYIGLNSNKYDISSSTGVYKIDYGHISDILFVDKTSSNASYSNDTNSIVTITQSDASVIKGTFNLTLHRNSSTYPATGDFTVYK